MFYIVYIPELIMWFLGYWTCFYFGGQIIVDKLKTGVLQEENDPDSVGLGLDLDTGLGVFDAFIASLSMIIVSEVSGFASVALLPLL